MLKKTGNDEHIEPLEAAAKKGSDHVKEALEELGSQDLSPRVKGAIKHTLASYNEVETLAR